MAGQNSKSVGDVLRRVRNVSGKPLKYIGNFGKMVLKAGGTEFLTNDIPAINDMYSVNEDLLRDTLDFIRDPASVMKRQIDIAMKTEVYRGMEEVAKNMIDDLKTGNFYDENRDRSGTFGDTDFGDFGGFDMDFDADGNWEDIPDADESGSEAEHIAEVQESNEDDRTKVTVGAIGTAAGAIMTNDDKNAKRSVSMSIKQHAQTMSAMSNLLTMTTSLHEAVTSSAKVQLELHREIGNQTIEALNGIKSTLNDILTAVQPKVEKPEFKEKEAPFSYNGALDIRAFIKNSIRNVRDNTPIGMAMGFDPTQMIEYMRDNPWGFLLGHPLFKKLIPTSTQAELKNFNNMLKGFFPSLLMRLYEMGEDENVAESSMLKSLAGKIFGYRQRSNSSIETAGNKIEEQAVFTHKVSKAITDVIPTQLAEIIGLLSGSRPKLFNYQTGKFVDVASIIAKQERQLNNLASSMETTSYLTDMMNSAIQFETEEQKKEMQDFIHKAMQTYARKNKIPNVFATPKEVAEDLGVSEDDKKLLAFMSLARAMPRAQQMQMALDIYESRANRDRSTFNLNNTLHTNSEIMAYSGIGNTELLDKVGKKARDNLRVELSGKELNEYYADIAKKNDKEKFSTYETLLDIRRMLAGGIITFSFDGGSLTGSGTISDLADALTTENENDDFITRSKKRALKKLDDDLKRKIDVETTEERRKEDEERRKEDQKKRAQKERRDDNFNKVAFSTIGSPDYDDDIFRQINLTEHLDPELENDPIYRAMRRGIDRVTGKANEISGKLTLPEMIQSIYKTPFQMVEQGLRTADAVMFKIVFGQDALEAFGDGNEVSLVTMMTKLFRGQVDKLQGWFSDKITGDNGLFVKIGEGVGKFLKPIVDKGTDRAKSFGRRIKSRVVGDKVGDQYEGGFASGAINRIRSSYNDLTSDTKSSFGSMKNRMWNFWDELAYGKKHVPVYGSKREDGTRPIIGEAVVHTGTGFINSFKNGFNKFKEWLFGDPDEDTDSKKKFKMVSDTVKEAYPDAILGAGIGAIGTAGFGFLTSLWLPGGPFMGALLGGLGGLISGSEKFKSYLFGDIGDDGKRIGGLISRETQDWVKKFFPRAGIGFGIGALLGNMGLLPMGMGPIIGGIFGSMTGMISSSERIKQAIFGVEGDDDSGFISKNMRTALMKNLPAWLLGGISGAALWNLISSVGLIPGLSLLPGGPIFAALGAIGVGLNADNIKNFLFGDEVEETVTDKDGKVKKVKKRHGGVFGSIFDFGKDKIVDPLARTFDRFGKATKQWFENDIEKPFIDALKPMKDAMIETGGHIKDLFYNTAKNIGDTVSNVIKETVGVDFKGAINSITSKLKEATNKLFSMIGKIIGGILSAPFKFINLMFTGGLEDEAARNQKNKKFSDSLPNSAKNGLGIWGWLKGLFEGAGESRDDKYNRLMASLMNGEELSREDQDFLFDEESRRRNGDNSPDSSTKNPDGTNKTDDKKSPVSDTVKAAANNSGYGDSNNNSPKNPNVPGRDNSPSDKKPKKKPSIFSPLDRPNRPGAGGSDDSGNDAPNNPSNTPDGSQDTDRGSGRPKMKRGTMSSIMDLIRRRNQKPDDSNNSDSPETQGDNDTDTPRNSSVSEQVRNVADQETESNKTKPPKSPDDSTSKTKPPKSPDDSTSPTSDTSTVSDKAKQAASDASESSSPGTPKSPSGSNDEPKNPKTKPQDVSDKLKQAASETSRPPMSEPSDESDDSPNTPDTSDAPPKGKKRRFSLFGSGRDSDQPSKKPSGTNDKPGGNKRSGRVILNGGSAFTEKDATSITSNIGKLVRYVKDIRDEVKGQLGGTGWNLDYIRILLKKQFGIEIDESEVGGNRKEAKKKRGILGRLFDKVTGIFDSILAPFRNAFDAITGKINQVKNFFKGLFDIPKRLLAIGTKVITTSGKLLGKFVSNVGTALKNATTATIKFMWKHRDILTNMVKSVVSGIGKVAKAGKDLVVGAAKFLNNGIKAIATTAGKAAKAIFSGLVKAGSALAKGIGKGIAGLGRFGINAIGSLFGKKTKPLGATTVFVDGGTLDALKGSVKLDGTITVLKGKPLIEPKSALPVYVVGGYFMFQEPMDDNGPETVTDPETGETIPNPKTKNAAPKQISAKQTSTKNQLPEETKKATEQAKEAAHKKKQEEQNTLRNYKTAYSNADKSAEKSKNPKEEYDDAIKKATSMTAIEAIQDAQQMNESTAIVPAEQEEEKSGGLLGLLASLFGKGLFGKLGKLLMGTKIGKLLLGAGGRGGLLRTLMPGLGTLAMGAGGMYQMFSEDGNKGWGARMLSNTALKVGGGISDISKTVHALGAGTFDEAVNNVGPIKTSIAKVINSLFNNRVVKSMAGALSSKFGTLAAKLTEFLATKGLNIAMARGASQALKSGAKQIAAFASGGTLAIAFAVADFTYGFGNAKKYFNVFGSDVTLGMRLTSAIANTLGGLLSLIPVVGPFLSIAVATAQDQIVQLIYGVLAGDDAKQQLAADQQKLQQATDAYNAENGTDLTVDEYAKKFNEDGSKKGIISTITGGIKTAASTVVGGAKALGSKVIGGVKAAGGWVADKALGFSDWFSNFGEKFSNTISNLPELLTEKINNFFGGLKEAVTNIPESIGKFLGKIFGVGAEGTFDIATFAVNVGSGFMKFLFGDREQGKQGFLAGLAKGLVNIGIGLGQLLLQTPELLVRAALGIGKGLIETVISGIGGVAKFVIELVKGIAEGIWRGFTSLLGAVDEGISSIPLIGGLWDGAKKLFGGDDETGTGRYGRGPADVNQQSQIAETNANLNTSAASMTDIGYGIGQSMLDMMKSIYKGNNMPDPFTLIGMGVGGSLISDMKETDGKKTTFASAVQSSVTQVLTAPAKASSSIGSKIVSGAKAFGSTIANTASSIWNKAKDVASSLFGKGRDSEWGTGPVTPMNQESAQWNQTSNDMARAGCGPTTAAMVASAYGKSSANPLEANSKSYAMGMRASDGGTNPEFFNKYASSHGFSMQKGATSQSALESNTRSGKPVVLMGKGGPFGSNMHYMVAEKSAGTGKTQIVDPAGGRRGIVSTDSLLRNTRTSIYSSGTNFGKGKSIYPKKIEAEFGRGTGDTALADKFVQVAVNEIGYEEKASNANLNDKVANPGSANYTKYGEWYGSNGVAWCAIFVSWCANQAGVPTSIIPKFAAVRDGINWFKNKGQWRDKGYRPQKGDIIFYTYSHVEIVTGSDEENVYTVGGNTSAGKNASNSELRNGGKVATHKYSLNHSSIKGYGLPNFGGTRSYGNAGEATTNSAGIATSSTGSDSGTTGSTSSSGGILGAINNKMTEVLSPFQSAVSTITGALSNALSVFNGGSDSSGTTSSSSGSTTSSGGSLSGAAIAKDSGGPLSGGSEYPKYSLTDAQKKFIAGVSSEEQDSTDLSAQRLEVSQMANLNEVTKKNGTTGEGILKTLKSGWYASKSVARGNRGDASPAALQAVEDVLVNGQRTLPRHVTEHDYYKDIDNIDLNPNTDTGRQNRLNLKPGTRITNKMGGSYQFYKFAGKDGPRGSGDPFGSPDAYIDKYKSDIPWTTGGSTTTETGKGRSNVQFETSMYGKGNGDISSIVNDEVSAYNNKLNQVQNSVQMDTQMTAAINNLTDAVRTSNTGSGNNQATDGFNAMAQVMGQMLKVLEVIAQNTAENKTVVVESGLSSGKQTSRAKNVREVSSEAHYKRTNIIPNVGAYSIDKLTTRD